MKRVWEQTKTLHELVIVKRTPIRGGKLMGIDGKTSL
jgi:hypothetical protein